jgi:hypothetical protein
MRELEAAILVVFEPSSSQPIKVSSFDDKNVLQAVKGVFFLIRVHVGVQTERGFLSLRGLSPNSQHKSCSGSERITMGSI